MNNEEEKSIDQNFDKKLIDASKGIGKQGAKAGKKVASKVGKEVMKKGARAAGQVGKRAALALGKAAMTALGAIGAKVLAILAIVIVVIILVVIAFFVVMELTNSSGDYTNAGAINENQIEDVVDSEKLVRFKQVKSLEGTNKSISDFFSQLTKRGYWIVDPEDKNWNIEQGKLPQLLIPQEAEAREIEDYFKQEHMYSLNGDFVYSVNSYAYKNQFIYPEHFLQSVPIKLGKNYDYSKKDSSKIERPYTIRKKELVDKDGALSIKSRKYNIDKKIFMDNEKVRSTHDYGLATVYQYRKEVIEQYAEGFYYQEDYLDPSDNKIKQKPLNQSFKVPVDGYPMDIWLLDIANTYTGEYVFQYEKNSETVGELVEQEGSINSTAAKIKIGEANGQPLYKYRKGSIVEYKQMPAGSPRSRIEIEAKLMDIEKEEKRKERELEVQEELEKEREAFLQNYFKYFTAYVPELVNQKFDYMARAGALGLGMEINMETGSGLNQAKYANALKYLPQIEKHAREFGVDPHLILAIMTQESGGDPNIKRPGGIMQLSWDVGRTISITAKNTNGQKVSHSLGGGEARKNVDDGIRFAVMKMANLYEKHNRNPIKSLQEYNFGVSGYMKSNHPDKWADDEKNTWIEHLEDARSYYANKEYGYKQSRSISYACALHLEKPKNLPVYGDLCYLNNVLRYYDKGASGGLMSSPIEKGEESGIEVEDGKVGNTQQQAGGFMGGIARLFGLSSKTKPVAEDFIRTEYEATINPSQVKEMLLYSQSYIDKTPMTITKAFEGVFHKEGTEDSAEMLDENSNFMSDFSQIKDVLNYKAGAGNITQAEMSMLTMMGLERPARTGSITSVFGHRTIGSVSRWHAGADLGLPVNQPLYAVSDGLVRAFNNSCPKKGFHDGKGGGCYVNGKPIGWGNFVQIIFPNGYYVVYGHMNNVPNSIKVGSPVKKGQVIGWSGGSGNSTGPHLHFELRRPNGEYINPIFILKAPKGTS